MSDIIDIIHRITYEINDQQLQAASKEVQANINKLRALIDENKRLQAQIQNTSQYDVAAKTKMQQAYQANQKQIEVLAKSVDKYVGSLTQANVAATQGTTAMRSATVATSGFNAALKATMATIGPMLLGMAQVAATLLAMQGAYWLLEKAVQAITGSNTEAAKRQKLLNEVNLQATEIYSKKVARLELIRAKLNDAATTEKDRLQIIKDYNREADKANRIDESQVNNLGEINRLISAQIELLRQRAIARAAEAVVAERYEALFKAQIEYDSRFPQASEKAIKENTARAEKLVDEAAKRLGIANKGYTQELIALSDMPDEQIRKMAAGQERFRILLDEQTRGKLQVIQKNLARIQAYRSGEHEGSSGTAARFKDLKELEKDAEDALRYAASLLDPEAFSKQTRGSTREIINVYERELQRLQAQLASITAGTFQSEENIRKKVTEGIEKQQAQLDIMLQRKQLTSPQRETLRGILGLIGDAQLEKELRDFNKKREEAHRKIDDELNALLLQEGEQRVQLIRDEFDRQAEAIDQEYQKQVESLRKAQDAMLRENEEKRKVGLIDEAEAAENAEAIEAIYVRLLDNLANITNQKRAKLALTLFDDAIAYEKTFFTQEQAEEAERVAAEVQRLSEVYINGQISYKKYQEQLTKTLRTESANRRELSHRELEDELRTMEEKLQAGQGILSNKELDAIARRIAELRIQIEAIKKEAAQAGVTDTKAGKDLFNERLRERIRLFVDVMNAGLQAAQSIAAAEEAAVNRQIAAQERRVERATAIAERGNAKIVQEEEERLQKLNQEREKSARQQTALNAIQTASASLLAVANAAAMGDGYSAAARVVAVIAALAAGFAAVKAISADNVAAFRHGEVDIKGPGSTTSDSIPARISRGESVINAEATAKNKAILEDINAGKTFTKIDLNRIAEMSYRQMPDLPVHNLQGMVIINQGGGQDYKQLLSEVKSLRQAIEEKPTSSWSLDRRGFIAMYQDEIKYQDKMKKL